MILSDGEIVYGKAEDAIESEAEGHNKQKAES